MSVSPAIWFQTILHMRREQIAHRVRNRGGRLLHRMMPARYQRYYEFLAGECPPRVYAGVCVARVTGIIQAWSAREHTDSLLGYLEGRYRFLNREIQFKGSEGIDWRRELHEGNNPLWRMTLAYLEWLVPVSANPSNDDLFPDFLVAVIESLGAQNGFSEVGVFRDVWNPYTVSNRLINLLVIGALLKARGGGGGHRMWKAIESHTNFCEVFLRKNLETELGYNHLLRNYTALVVSDAFRASRNETTQPSKYLDAAIQCLESQVLPDGGHAERSPGYHLHCLRDARILCACAPPCSDLANKALEIERAMVRAALALTLSDGFVGAFNDCCDATLTPTATILSRMGMQLPANHQTCADVLLKDTGYWSIWHNLDSAIMDCGPCGPSDNPGHAHADFLSCEVCLQGERVLVDGGTPTYSRGALRDLCRSSWSHNGPALRNREPLDFWSSFRVGFRGACHTLEIGDCLTGQSDPIHGRVLAAYQTGYLRYGMIVARALLCVFDEGFLFHDLWIGKSAWDGYSRLMLTCHDLRQEQQDDSPPTFRFRTRENLRVGMLQVIQGSCTGYGEGVFWPKFNTEEQGSWVTLKPVVLEERPIGRLSFWLGLGPPSAAAVARQACVFDQLESAVVQRVAASGQQVNKKRLTAAGCVTPVSDAGRVVSVRDWPAVRATARRS